MAQIYVSLGATFKGQKAEVNSMLGPKGRLAQAVKNTHYGKGPLGVGEITLAVADNSRRDVFSWVGISEGSDNWPRYEDSGRLLDPVDMEAHLDRRVQDIITQIGSLSFENFSVLGIKEANGVCPQALPGSGNNTQAITIVRDFSTGYIHETRRFGVERAISGLLGDIQLDSESRAEPKIQFPSIDRELSMSNAGAEVEVVLPPAISSPLEASYLDEFALAVSDAVGIVVGKPTNCFVQAPNATGWHQAA